MNDFNSLFPNFAAQCGQLRSVLLPITLVLLAVGMISSTITGQRSPGAYLRTFGRTAAYIVLLTQLTEWGNLVSRAADDTMRNTLHANPGDVDQRYREKLLAIGHPDNKKLTLSTFLSPSALYEALVNVALFLLGAAANVILFYAYLAQKFILYIGYGLSPIFVGFLAVRTLQSIGIGYLLGLTGVMLWPLGWGAASIMTQGLLDFMIDQSFLSGGAVGTVQFALQNSIGLGVLAVWLIFSTIAAPVILQKALSSGAQVGSALLSGGAVAAVAGATGGASAAAAFSNGRGLKAALGGTVAGAVAAPMALIGASMSGSTYSPSAAALASLGHHRSPGKKSDTDLTKDQLIEQLLKRL